MGKYLRKKIYIYLITFFVAVSIDWAIPRFMPGDPVSLLLSRFSGLPEATEKLNTYFTKAFGLDQPLWKQYINFWISLFKGDLGVSVFLYPKSVVEIIKGSIIYDILLLVPAIILSWIVGNKLGALAAINKKTDNSIIPIFFFLTSSPYFWMALLMAWVLGFIIPIFPLSGAYSYTITPSFTLEFILDFLYHLALPFLSLFLVMMGGWAIGMRNMIIYEMGSNYSKYMESLGASDKLIRSYAYRNAILPQVTGLALQLGTIILGSLTTQSVFSYPGLGFLLLQAIQNQDYFLIQGIFLIIVIMVLVGNFIVDIIYVFIDPRIRYSYIEEV
ncbi:ABC transporter permease [Marinitoga sp. 38H-ov]|uniref:ABC transporter permease n=1 Tax=Marinitoga sp. 38H-ov TaxID=1755814 RepID=UPI0013E9CB68|nr:ABC transporter permease [Marinitoga sp. 38H-ov]KAF2955316.1 peptide ABC transporter permease [Marinitoga sp. 38H-ov]